MVGVADEYDRATGGLPVGMDSDGDMDGNGMDHMPDAEITDQAVEQAIEEEETTKEPNWLQVGLEELCTLYPRKVSRKKAESSWRTEVRKRDIPAIMQDVERRIESADWRKEGGKFIPHPSTYLNQRRWEDQGIELPDAGPDDDRPEPDWDACAESIRLVMDLEAQHGNEAA